MSSSKRLVDEVTTLVVALEKSTESEPTLDILKRMDDLQGLTVHDMKVSKVVFAVKKIRKAAGMSEEVTGLAARLIDKWKRLAEKEQAAAAAAAAATSASATNNKSAASSEGSAAPKAAADKKNDPPPSSKSDNHKKQAVPSAPPKAAPSPTVSDDGGPDIKKFDFAKKGNISDARQKMRNLFFKLFLKDLENDQMEEALAIVASEIETAVHQAFDSDTNKKAYADKIRSLKYNLERNADLRSQLVSKELSPEDLVKLKPEDMLTSEERAKQDKKKSEFVESRQLDYWDERAEDLNKKLGLADASGTFRCGRCKGEKTTYTAKQTRSSDEPMTMFIRCLTCGNRWKQN